MKKNGVLKFVDVFSGLYNQRDVLAGKSAGYLLDTYGAVAKTVLPLETKRLSNVLGTAEGRKSLLSSKGYTGMAAVIEEPHLAWTDDTFRGAFDTSLHSKVLRLMIKNISSTARHHWCTLFVLSQSVDFIFNEAIFANLTFVWLSNKITDAHLKTVFKRIILRKSMKEAQFIAYIRDSLAAAGPHTFAVWVRDAEEFVFVRGRSPAEFSELYGLETELSASKSEASASTESEASIQTGESEAATIVRLRELLAYYQQREREVDVASTRYEELEQELSVLRPSAAADAARLSAYAERLSALKLRQRALELLPAVTAGSPLREPDAQAIRSLLSDIAGSFTPGGSLVVDTTDADEAAQAAAEAVDWGSDNEEKEEKLEVASEGTTTKQTVAFRAGTSADALLPENPFDIF